MKQILKAIILVGLFSFVNNLYFGTAAYAETFSESITDTCSWRYDDETNTLTISGQGDLSEQNIGWTALGNSFFSTQHLIIEDGITSIPRIDFNKQVIKSVTIGKNVQTEDNFQYICTNKFTVDPENDFFTTYDNSLYTKDFKKLIRTVSLMGVFNTPSQLRTICNYSLNNGLDNDGTLVIPWGVTTLETFALAQVAWNTTIVFPDTLTYINADILSVPRDSSVTFIYSSANTVIREQVSERGEINCIMLNSVSQYYQNNSTVLSPTSGFVTENNNTYYYENNIKLTGLQYIDGKAYYFGNDGVMQKSKWVYAEGNWYYLNDYGAGVVNCWRLMNGKYYYLGSDGKMKANCWIKDYGYWYCVKADGSRYESSWAKIGGVWYWFGGSGKMAQSQWLKLGGKWYYFTGSGAMATNKWIKSGTYWYYLGSDGAMLTGTTTPDGYRVDNQGRWI